MSLRACVCVCSCVYRVHSIVDSMHSASTHIRPDSIKSRFGLVNEQAFSYGVSFTLKCVQRKTISMREKLRFYIIEIQIISTSSSSSFSKRKFATFQMFPSIFPLITTHSFAKHYWTDVHNWSRREKPSGTILIDRLHLCQIIVI